MAHNDRDTLLDTFVDEDEPKSSALVLEAIVQAEKTFRRYNELCDLIDRSYSARATLGTFATELDFSDQEYDLFWSSMEVLKPAIYAKPPKPVVATRFSDADLVDKAVAELLERVISSEFERSDIDLAMLSTRDDLALHNRGVMWVMYESGGKMGKRVCLEHLDRRDFLHEPARKWTEVGWVARRAWMTKRQMKTRFKKNSGDAYESAAFAVRRDDRDNGAADETEQAAVWEVWHRADERVYWVCEGVDVFLDEGAPHLNIKGFFPCPRPAYGTRQPASLMPVPDFVRYANHLEQINIATRKIYDLMDLVRVRAFIPAGGDVGDAIEVAIKSADSGIIIPIPAASFLAGASGGFIQFMPLEDIANTIRGLIEARTQLFEDFYQLSGIADIMRGATESDETLGAQRLKAQYGSVRVRDKIDELVRVARDAAQICGEIVCDNFDEKTLLEVAQMDFPTRADIDKRIKETKKQAESEMEAAAEAAERAALQAAQQDQPLPPGQAPPPEAADAGVQGLQQALDMVAEKYQPELDQLANTVVIEDVMTSIKDKRVRALTIDIETDSTIMVDEMAEKANRTEFLSAFSSATQALQPLLQTGEAGAKLAGGILKFAMAPYRANRELNALIDDFIEDAPRIAQNLMEQDDDAGLADAQKALADAEMEKARAQMAKVEADSQLRAADLQRRLGESQAKAMKDQAEAQMEMHNLQVKAGEAEAKMAETEARINKMQAETAEILNKIGLDVRKQSLEEYKAETDTQLKAGDQALKAEQQVVDQEFRAVDSARADRDEGAN